MNVLRHFEIDSQQVALIRFAGGDGAIAYQRQLAEDNRGIRVECQLEPGYAHIESDGSIWRFNRQIGTVNWLDGSVSNAIAT